jgi:hypothetical protein
MIQGGVTLDLVLIVKQSCQRGDRFTWERFKPMFRETRPGSNFFEGKLKSARHGTCQVEFDSFIGTEVFNRFR